MKQTGRAGFFAGVVSAVLVACSGVGFGQIQAERAEGERIPNGIVWYGVLEDGVREAKATQRPILLIAAAPQCAGVPGMW